MSLSQPCITPGISTARTSLPSSCVLFRRKQMERCCGERKSGVVWCRSLCDLCFNVMRSVRFSKGIFRYRVERSDGYVKEELY
ncbi:hypothetical protein RSAG8_02490, partial [Rhizoctonia solani AG-8 WAC10335]